MTSSRAIVVLSGGLDSATALWWVKQQGWEPSALTFKYGALNQHEVRVARRVGEAGGVVRHMVVDAGFLRPIKFIEGADRPERFPLVYIPSRNIILFGAAAYYAELYGLSYIVTGHTHIDPFPDSKPGFVQAVNAALAAGSWLGKEYGTRVIMPLGDLDKAGIVKLALHLGVPVELTWSCYHAGRYACGECNACQSRLKAFRQVGVRDPVRYRRGQPLPSG